MYLVVHITKLNVFDAIEDGGDAMEVDGADRTDGATSSGLLAHSPAARLSFI